MVAEKEVENSSEAEPKPPGAPAPIFISYASQDAAVANSVVGCLEAQGLKCWLAPRDVRPGAQYADAAFASGTRPALSPLLRS
jgi:hypothetical protein